MSPVIWRRKMKLRMKLVLLAVCSLSFSIGILVGHQQSRKYERLKRATKAAVIVYRNHGLSYLKELNNAKVNMTDPLLISAIREEFLRSPSPDGAPYKLKDPYLNSTALKQAETVADMLNSQSEGFFVEARAFDGETGSHTFLLELRLHWEGLLVEPDPIYFAQLAKKHRKAWASNSCISTRTHPQVMRLSRDLGTINFSKLPASQKSTDYVDVQCLPLYSLLLALNRTTVGYLSLNVAGSELDVLRTIPFNDLNIRMLSVNYFYKQKGKGILLEYMKKQGYHLYGSRIPNDYRSILLIFVK